MCCFVLKKVKTKAVGNVDGKDRGETSPAVQLVKEVIREAVQGLNRQQSLQFRVRTKSVACCFSEERLLRPSSPQPLQPPPRCIQRGLRMGNSRILLLGTLDS